MMYQDRLFLYQSGTGVRCLRRRDRRPCSNQPPYNSPADPTWGLQSHEEHQIATEDGISLHVWVLRAPGIGAPTIVMCHANSGNMGSCLRKGAYLSHECRSTVVLWDYRGYGSSSGVPSESGIRRDSMALMNWLSSRADIDPGKIFWFGQSFGGAVVMHAAADARVGDSDIAFGDSDDATDASSVSLSPPTSPSPSPMPATFPIAGIIIENCFTSFIDVAIARFPWLRFLGPLKSNGVWLQWNSEVIARSTGKRGLPALFISSSHDEIVPPRHMRKLYEEYTAEAPPPLLSNFVIAVGASHNDIMCSPHVLVNEVNRFIERAISDGVFSERGRVENWPRKEPHRLGARDIFTFRDI